MVDDINLRGASYARREACHLAYGPCAKDSKRVARAQTSKVECCPACSEDFRHEEVVVNCRGVGATIDGYRHQGVVCVWDTGILGCRERRLSSVFYIASTSKSVG